MPSRTIEACGLGVVFQQPARLLYPLFCAIYHFKYGLPKIDLARKSIKSADYPKVRIALEKIDVLIATIKAAAKDHVEADVSADERKMYAAFDEHWVHAEERTTLTEYICKQISKALKA